VGYIYPVARGWPHKLSSRKSNSYKFKIYGFTTYKCNITTIAKLCHHNTITISVYYTIAKKKQTTVLPLNPFRPFETFIINSDIKHLKLTEWSRKRFYVPPAITLKLIILSIQLFLCGLDVSKLKCQWEKDFPHPSRLALEPTQPPVLLAPALCRQ
jgi:hypothetical protein